MVLVNLKMREIRKLWSLSYKIEVVYDYCDIYFQNMVVYVNLFLIMENIWHFGGFTSQKSYTSGNFSQQLEKSRNRRCIFVSDCLGEG